MTIYNSEDLNHLLAMPWRDKLDTLSEPVQQTLLKTSGKDGLDILQSLDIESYLPACMMPKVGITSTSLGLEVRSPFLDNNVAALVASLPPYFRTTEREQGKVLLKHLLLKHGFPESFVYRKKQGFGLPINYWFLPGGRARILLETLIAEYEKELSEYLEISTVNTILASHSLKSDKSARLWLILVFALWLTGRSLT
jgi:asparagine synthase (glutamine-hydrolysing)